MKRILLTGFAFAAFFAASAQTAITETQTDATTGFPYVGAEFAQDDFADGRSYGLETGGVFWWPDVMEQKPATGTPFFTAKRDSVPNGMQYTVSNAKQQYEPVGVSFGGPEATETTPANPNYIDLSNDATTVVEVENKSDFIVRFRVALQDINGNLIDTKKAVLNNATPWNGEIYIDLPALSTKTFTLTDADAKDGGEAKYPAAPATPNIETDFDFTKVKGVNFTIISNDQENKGITDAVVVIRNFKLGDAPAVVPAVLAPTDLSATDDSDGITLAWTDASDNEDSFVIYRKLMGEADFSLLATVDADVTTYLDSKAGLTLDAEHVYKVASTLGEAKEFSNDAMVTPVGFGDDIVKLKASIYPNPATSTLNFSEELEGVVIFNSKGVEVFSAAKAKNVNVAEFSKGIYYLQTSKGSKSFIVE